MGFKINVQIGTDQGITSEAYVRISNYSISKQGSALFNLQLFQNKEAALSTTPTVGMYSQARNVQVGESFSVNLSKEELIELETKSIFEFSYGKLSERLRDLFGQDSITKD